MRRQTRLVVGIFIAAALLAIDVPVRSQGPARVGTATNLDVSPNPTAAGQAVKLTARVALANPGPNAPTGTVEFFDLDTPLGTATLSTSNATHVAVLELTTLSAGPHTISAKYSVTPTAPTVVRRLSRSS